MSAIKGAIEAKLHQLHPVALSLPPAAQRGGVAKAAADWEANVGDRVRPVLDPASIPPPVRAAPAAAVVEIERGAPRSRPANVFRERWIDGEPHDQRRHSFRAAEQEGRSKKP